jgi:hypothetical protein
MKAGKIKCCVVCAALLGAASTQATLFVSDSFATGGSDYVAGALDGQGPAVSGMTGNWLNGSSHQVSDTGLTYGGAGYANGGGGSVISAVPSTGRGGRLLTTAYDANSTGTVYLSFLMQVSNGNTTQYKALELHDGGFADSTDRHFALGVQQNDFQSNDGNCFGFKVLNSIESQLTTDGLNTDVNLFVVKFDFSDVAASDSVTVWQNPTLGGAGDPTGGVTVSGVDMSFDRITFADYNSTDVANWDELRMGDSFSDVVAIPEPATMGLVAVFGGGLLFFRRRFMM